MTANSTPDESGPETNNLITVADYDEFAFPPELNQRFQWVCWRYGDRGDGKPAKIPIDPYTGKPADVTDPDCGTTVVTARLHHEEGYVHERGYGEKIEPTTDGLGFVFTDDDPYIGIDLDNCVDEDGNIAEWAQRIVDEVDSYAEFSPSGTGIHIITKGVLPEGNVKRGNVELYEKDRYLTVTGKHVPSTPLEVWGTFFGPDDFYGEFIGYDDDDSSHDATDNNEGIVTGGGEDSTADGNSPLSDDEVLAKAKRAKNGAKFTRLWNGDTSGYPSRSEADDALCCELVYWCQGDRAQVDRLFRRSKLMRPKWDEQRGNRTYGERTIDAAMAIVDTYYDPNYGQVSQVDQQSDRIMIDDVREVVIEEFDEETWKATEAVLAAHATLLLNETASTGLVLEGPSGSGKTTVLRFFEDPELEDMLYRSDDVTPASFVSHDASKSDEQLEEIDLLPRLKGKTLLSRDMATWFAGDVEMISKRMSVMTNLLDGEGYTRDTGTHGQRGYTGSEYRFNLIGASTPLPPRAWQVMGNMGNRLVFYERHGTTDLETVIDDIVEGSDYSKKVARCRKVVRDFLRQVWDETSGPASVDWEESPETEVKQALAFLTRLVQVGRATVKDEAVQLEGPHRIGATLWTIARGRALLDGRRHVTMADMEVCARIALSTMSKERRPIIRTLLDPRARGQLTAGEIEAATGLSRPTVLNRMEEIAALGIADCTEVDDDGRKPKVLTLRSDFGWPDSLSFPEVRS